MTRCTCQNSRSEISWCKINKRMDGRTQPILLPFSVGYLAHVEFVNSLLLDVYGLNVGDQYHFLLVMRRI